MIDIWNAELVEVGVKIMIRRARFVNEFRKYIEKKFKDIVCDSYIPILEYDSELIKGNDEIIDEYHERNAPVPLSLILNLNPQR